MAQTMLTTTDNPFDPFKDFKSWYAFDMSKGYDTCGFLARSLHLSNELTDQDLELYQEMEIDHIVDQNILGIYKKVVLSDADTSESST